MVHAKVAVADGHIAAIGSTNLNRLSFYGNSETLLLTTEPNVVSGIRTLINEESAATAEKLSPSSWNRHLDRRPWAELAASAVAMLL
jgi:phosphatidylserine/phosphatidylglycerophosphate/cardiolipin synthase-like enzyme